MTKNEQYLKFIQTCVGLVGMKLHYRIVEINNVGDYVCLDFFRDNINHKRIVTLRRDKEEGETIDDCLGCVISAMVCLVFNNCPDLILEDTDVSQNNGAETIGTNC